MFFSSDRIDKTIYELLLLVDVFSLILSKSICAYVKVGASEPAIGFWIADRFPTVLLAMGAAAVEGYVGKSRLA